MKLVQVKARVTSCAGSVRGTPDAEYVLVRAATDSGVTGWGASNPSAARVVAAMVECLVAPLLEGVEFGGTGFEIEALYRNLLRHARECGETGGFMLDAIAAADLALWDLAGRIHQSPVAALIAGEGARPLVETYVDALAGDTAAERLAGARALWRAGFRRFRVARPGGAAELLEAVDETAAVCGAANVAADACHSLNFEEAVRLGKQLDRLGALRLENPLASADAAEHAALASGMRTPIAAGGLCRTKADLDPFLRGGAVSIVQPDVGRCGLSEALRIACAAKRAGIEVVPRPAGAAAPLLAATLHFSAAVPNCTMAPYRPAATAVAEIREGKYVMSSVPGLGLFRHAGTPPPGEGWSLAAQMHL